MDAMDQFNRFPWKVGLLDTIQERCIEMMTKHYHKGSKQIYLNSVRLAAETRKKEINERIDRISHQMQFGTGLGGTPGRGLKGIYALESQKHKGSRIRGSDFQVLTFNSLQMMEFGQQDEILQEQFENPGAVKESLSDGNFSRLSRQDLYALKKFYKNQRGHSNFRMHQSEFVPYFNDDQRNRLRLTFEGNQQQGAGARVSQNGAPYDTRGFGGGTRERAELALYACSISGSFFAMDGFRGTGEDVFLQLGLEHEDMLNHSSFLSGGNAASAGWLRAVNGELTDINNDSGHYKPSARDLSLAITIIGSNNDISRLRAAARISDTHLYYFPASELYAEPNQPRKASWNDITQKVALSAQEYREVFMRNLGAGPVPFGDLVQQCRQRTVSEMIRTESDDPNCPFIKLKKLYGGDKTMAEMETHMQQFIFPFHYV
jgi:hypothetical protein